MRRRRIWILSLSIVYLLFTANWIYPAIRTPSAMVNHTVMVLVFFLPLLIGILGLLAFKRFARVLVCTVVSPLALCSTVLVILSLMFSWPAVVKRGFDPSFEPVRSYHVSKSWIAVYRTDGGATTSYGIVARHEKQLVPGLILVKRVFVATPGYDATVTNVGSNLVRIVSPPYGDKRPNPYEAIIRLRPWVYL